MNQLHEPPAKDSVKIVYQICPVKDDAEEEAENKTVAKFPSRTREYRSLTGKVYTLEKKFKPDATQEKMFSEANKANMKDTKKTVFIWNDTTTLLLLHLYSQYKDDFSSTSFRKKVVWQKIASDMQQENYDITGIQCENKFKGLLINYKKIKDNNNTSERSRKTFQYLNEMDAIFADDPTIIPVSRASSTEEFDLEDSDEETSTSPSCSREKRKCSTGKLYTFDKIFKSNATQEKEKMYNEETKSIMNDSQKSVFIWNDAATRLFLHLYNQYKSDFFSTSMKKKVVWQKIANDMQEENFDVSGVQCENKFKGLLSSYNKVKDNKNTSRRSRKIFRYLNEMDEIFSEDLMMLPAAEASSTEGYILPDNDPERSTSPSCSKEKRKSCTSIEDEPGWFKRYRIEAEKRHQERMEAQNKFLGLFEQFIQNCKKVK